MNNPNNMFRSLVKRIALIAFFCIAAGQVSAQYWYANPDASGAVWRDYFKNFNQEDNGGTNPSVNIVNNSTYGKVWRINKPAGAKRAEFSRAQINGVDYDFDAGDTYYVGFRFRADVLNSITREDDEVTVFQWKASGSNQRQNYPFNMEWNPLTKEYSLNLYGPTTTGQSQSSRKATVWRSTLNENQWVTIVIGFKFSTDPGAGWVSLWKNGSKQTLSDVHHGSNYSISKWGDNNRQAYHRTKDGSYTYPKWGAYNESSRKYNINVDLSDLRIDTSYSSARPQ